MGCLIIEKEGGEKVHERRRESWRGEEDEDEDEGGKTRVLLAIHTFVLARLNPYIRAC